MRFSGDAVAIIAAETEKAALKAMKLIKVKYQVLEAVLDFRTAKDNPVLGRLKVGFEHSYEPTGPFGAKSIGEIVINTPGPAIAHAIYRATGKWFHELPITPEQIAMSLTRE